MENKKTQALAIFIFVMVLGATALTGLDLLMGFTRMASVEIQGMHDLFQKLQGAAIAFAVFNLHRAFPWKSSKSSTTDKPT